MLTSHSTTWFWFLRIFTGVLVSIFAMGCSKDLSREEAEKLIKSAQQMAIYSDSVPIRAPKELVFEAREQGIQISQNKLLFFSSPDRILLGDELLKEVNSKIEFEKDTGIFLFKTKESMQLEVQVTGITEDVGSKGVRVAEFNWRQIDVPDVAARFAADGGSGVAGFRLYDDGWRIQSIAIEFSNSPRKLSDAQSAARQADIEIVQQNIRAEAERAESARRMKKEAEARRANRLRVAQTSSVEHGSHKFSSLGAYDRLKDRMVTVTDTSLVFESYVYGSSHWDNGLRLTYDVIKGVNADENKIGMFKPYTTVWLVRIQTSWKRPDELKLYFRSQSERDKFQKLLIDTYQAWARKYGEFSGWKR